MISPAVPRLDELDLIDPPGRSCWTQVVTVVAKEPALLSSAVRASLLAAVGFGLDWSPEAIAGLMIAVEAWLALATRAFSVPAREVQAKVDQAKAEERVEIHDYLNAARPLRARPPEAP